MKNSRFDIIVTFELPDGNDVAKVVGFNLRGAIAWREFCDWCEVAWFKRCRVSLMDFDSSEILCAIDFNGGRYIGQ